MLHLGKYFRRIRKKSNLTATFPDVTSRYVPSISRKGIFIEVYRHCYRTTIGRGCFAVFIGPARLGHKTSWQCKGLVGPGCTYSEYPGDSFEDRAIVSPWDPATASGFFWGGRLGLRYNRNRLKARIATKFIVDSAGGQG